MSIAIAILSVTALGLSALGLAKRQDPIYGVAIFLLALACLLPVAKALGAL